MSDIILQQKKAEAVWIAHSLFHRGKTAGSTANLSFLHDSRVYITGTGSCFGTLTEQDFAIIDPDGSCLGGAAPSKEYPLHLMMYQGNKSIGAVIHTHSFYAAVWSCWVTDVTGSAIPNYTPYLAMKLGEIGLVPYAPPGSEELFSYFSQVLDERKGYLLRNHGPVVGDRDLMSAFYGQEELEESARIAWELRHESAEEIT